MNLKLRIILFSCLGTWLTCPIACAEKETPDNVKNIAAVREVLSGKRTVANAAWWGFDKEDSTEALQSAINSGASKVIVPYVGGDWIVQPIDLVGNQEIVFEKGVEVVARGNKYPSRPKFFAHKYDSCLFKATDKTNITLRGYGATLRMRKAQYMAIPQATRGGSRHILRLNSCNKVTLLGLTLKESGGDGIMITGSGKRSSCKDILIKDVNCDKNYRNAVTVGSVDGLVIENCLLENTTGSELKGGGGPAAGIDFEPWDKKHDILRNIVVRNCTVKNNGMFGIVVNTARSKPLDDVDILIEDCVVSDNNRTNLYVSRVYDDGPGGLIKFKNVITKGGVWGARIRSKSSQKARVVFENCIWTDIKRARGAYPVNIYLPKEEADKVAKPGGIEFISCRIFDAQNRPAVKYTGVIKPLHNISGTLYVTNDKRKGNLFDWGGAKLNNITVKTHLGIGAFIEK